MKTTPLLFDIEDHVVSRPSQRVAPVIVETTEDDVTGVAGIALFGELLDHLGLVEAADRRNLRPIGPGGYSGGGATARSSSSSWLAATSSPTSRSRRRSDPAAARQPCPGVPHDLVVERQVI